MDPDKEKMQTLLEKYTTTVNPSYISSSFLESPINSCIHSNNSIHNCSESCNNYSCYTYNTLTNSPPPYVLDTTCLGSSLSCATNSSLTPQPIKKLKSPPDSDAGTDLLNICRICQLPGDSDDILISPCRCSGSLKFVHYACLTKWIEISTRKTKKIPSCELCNFLYVRHKRFKFRNCNLPRITNQDKCLHIIFLITIVVMVTCAVATVMCFLSDNGQTTHAKTYLSTEEVITLTCGVMFFVSFFLAMTVEIKARHTVYRLLLKFITQNTEWQIEPYDKTRDSSCSKPKVFGV